MAGNAVELSCGLLYLISRITPPKSTPIHVGEQVPKNEVEIWDKSLTEDRRVRFAVDEEVHAEPPAEPTKQVALGNHFDAVCRYRTKLTLSSLGNRYSLQL